MGNPFLDEADRRRSSVTTWYDRAVPSLTEVQRQQLDEALDDPRISANVISDVLASWGFTASHQAVGNHRRRRVK